MQVIRWCEFTCVSLPVCSFAGECEFACVNEFVSVSTRMRVCVMDHELFLRVIKLQDDKIQEACIFVSGAQTSLTFVRFHRLSVCVCVCVCLPI